MTSEEMHRRLERAESEINAIKTALAVSEAEHTNTKGQLKDVQGNIKWAVLGVLGSIIAAVMNFLTKGMGQ